MMQEKGIVTSFQRSEVMLKCSNIPPPPKKKNLRTNPSKVNVDTNYLYDFIQPVLYFYAIIAQTFAITDEHLSTDVHFKITKFKYVLNY